LLTLSGECATSILGTLAVLTNQRYDGDILTVLAAQKLNGNGSA